MRMDSFSEYKIVFEISMMEEIRIISSNYNIREDELIEWFIRAIEEMFHISTDRYSSMDIHRYNFIDKTLERYKSNIYRTLSIYLNRIESTTLVKSFSFIPFNSIGINFYD